MRDSPRSPKVKTNGSRFEGNRIINPHSRIPKSTNKQTNIFYYLYTTGILLLYYGSFYGSSGGWRCKRLHTLDTLAPASCCLHGCHALSWNVCLFVCLLTLESWNEE